MCVYLHMCLEPELPGSATHTFSLHACVFGESKAVLFVTLRHQTRCWACGGTAEADCRLHSRLEVLSHSSLAVRQRVEPCRPPQEGPAEGKTPVGQHDHHAG